VNAEKVKLSVSAGWCQEGHPACKTAPKPLVRRIKGQATNPGLPTGHTKKVAPKEFC